MRATCLMCIIHAFYWMLIYREHYSGDNFDADLQCIPIVGGFCCAQFSEDECWYRAKVVDYKVEEESLGEWLSVLCF